MAKLLEGHHLPCDTDNGAVLTKLAATTASGAFGDIHLRNPHRDLFRRFNVRFQKDMTVGFFDVTIEILHGPARSGQRYGQVRGDRGFARSAFAAGDGDFHAECPPSVSSQSNPSVLNQPLTGSESKQTGAGCAHRSPEWISHFV
jgi:hypothetical protein